MMAVPAILPAENQNGQDIKIKMPKCRGSIYELLNRVSGQSGYLFIYDSQLIENDRIARIPAGEYSLQEAVHKITGNDELKIRIMGNHILLYVPLEVIPVPVQAEEIKTEEQKFFSLEGTLIDRMSGEPIIYGTISVSNHPNGTVTNQNGSFKLTLPDSLLTSNIRFSHIGYITREIGAALLAEGHINFYMDQKVIPLQEIVVRVVDPLRTIREMMLRRNQNYSHEPVYLTAFYREGVEYKNSMTLSEAVFKIYKTGYVSSAGSEQVKMLKMRRIVNPDDKDTLVAKIKSSISSCLLLDLVKNPPEFLLQENQPQYVYTHTDITTIEDRRVYVISFTQSELITDPLYCGELYIDAENFSLLKIRFEINPVYVRKTSDDLIVRKSKNFDIAAERVVYEVTYKPWNGIYYINHIRGDLNFKVRKRGRLFSSELHVWFEMVNCNTETQDVRRFTNEERISTRDIFSETTFIYDKDFWGNLNVILPEEKLKEVIKQYNFNQERK